MSSELDELKFIRKFCNALVVMTAISTQRSVLRLPAIALVHYYDLFDNVTTIYLSEIDNTSKFSWAISSAPSAFYSQLDYKVAASEKGIN
ncbi:hypothetical protein T10_2816 [Trichinella papuae]|uniref:Uncharacterized protein n=1 Tax=Trichinella papuae TaxID=268474 RepID=A0A0V1N8W1_9BILA|nr:hypothetical protein T10_2816 [Trichinella papuae]